MVVQKRKKKAVHHREVHYQANPTLLKHNIFCDIITTLLLNETLIVYNYSLVKMFG